jgi:hypothetical protein
VIVIVQIVVLATPATVPLIVRAVIPVSKSVWALADISKVFPS